jgi:hypothetical protein
MNAWRCFAVFCGRPNAISGQNVDENSDGRGAKSPVFGSLPRIIADAQKSNFRGQFWNVAPKRHRYVRILPQLKVGEKFLNPTPFLASLIVLSG